MKFAIIGGDLRIIRLAEMLAKDSHEVYTYGLEKAKELKDIQNIIECDTIESAIQEAEIIVGPIPISSNGETVNTPFGEKELTIREMFDHMKTRTIIAGAISPKIQEIAKLDEINIIDIMESEELAILNTIATAEGTIQLAIENTDRILHGSRVLVLGFGRIGKVLARKLIGLSAVVTCAARKDEDFAWIQAYGYKVTNINNIGKDLKQYDIIINTVPHLILTEKRLEYVKDNVLLIDLASNPGGIDRNVVKERKLKFIWALSLPGKVAPTTSAEFIYNMVLKVSKNIKDYS